MDTDDGVKSELTIVEKDKFEAETSPNIPEELLKPYYFGCRGFHPKWMQILANRKFFAFITSFITLLQSAIVNGFLPVILSTLEKRYNLSSTEAGALISVYDATFSISVIFVAYFGGKSHKPRLIGLSVITIGIGAVIFSSPQFLFGSYIFDDSTNENSTSVFCTNVSTGSSRSDSCHSVNAGAYTFLILGMILIGLGTTPIYSVIPAYIDEIVFPKNVSLYLAVYLVPSVIGPAIGFGLGSGFLSLNVDPWASTDLTPEDPQWVGAWWIGHLLFGFLFFLLSVPFLMFPRYLPDSHLVRQERAKEMAKIYSSKYANENSLTIVVKMFPTHIKRLLLNPSFMLMSFGLTTVFIIKDGLIGFGPKYIETMFNLTATVSGLLAGGIAIVGAGIGISSGGLIIFLCKLKGRQAASILWIVLLVAIPASALYFVRCPSPQVAGISVPYADGSQSGQDSGLCAMLCNCNSADSYDPVCGADSLTYFTSCHAGCMTRLQTDPGGEFIYENCTCVEESFANTSMNLSSAVSGTCATSCNYLWIFVVFLGILVCLLLLVDIPVFYVTLRVVADDQRHLALAFQSVIYRVCGSIPGPLLFGVVFDSACVAWNYDCGRRGNCWVYDNVTLSLNAFALTIPCCILATVLLFLHWVFYPKSEMTAKVNEISS